MKELDRKISLWAADLSLTHGLTVFEVLVDMIMGEFHCFNYVVERKNAKLY